MAFLKKTQGPTPSGSGLETLQTFDNENTLERRVERAAPSAFLMPAVLLVLFISILPLILSLYISLINLAFVPGGFKLTFVGLQNYIRMLTGLNQAESIGVFNHKTWLGWALFAIAAAVALWLLVRYALSRHAVSGLLWRVITAVISLAFLWVVIFTLIPPGTPGALVITLIYVFVDITVQYSVGLLLAMLCVQNIPGRHFFRVVFLLPMMITPVGVAYLFLMLTDTVKGPFLPLWNAVGLANFSWVNVAWGARVAVMIGDTWQWIPFMFIVLVAALESQPVEHVEAAVVDGASPWQIFWNLTLPDILPVSLTVVLIRMIEAFKIVDLPNVLTNGGPGTATESLSLQSYIYWRNLDIGGSAAIAYVLLFVATFFGLTFVNLLRSRAVRVL